MDQVVERSVAQQRFLTTLAVLFSVAALLLAALGIYGVVSYGVDRRTSEIGFRMAPGARASAVLAMVLSQSMRPILAGLVMDMVGAVFVGRPIESLLFETDAHSPLVFAAVAALLTTCIRAGMLFASPAGRPHRSHHRFAA
jgi:putative ABC transport system permease protein